jgi:hypothetical protein
MPLIMRWDSVTSSSMHLPAAQASQTCWANVHLCAAVGMKDTHSHANATNQTYNTTMYHHDQKTTEVEPFQDF